MSARSATRSPVRLGSGVLPLGVVLSFAMVFALYFSFTLPPRARVLSSAVPPTIAFGAYHIHSVRSDGTGTPDEIAAAASRAGLTFVILTDHGDGTRQPDPPAYRHGVLCIDAVEFNTFAGHLVALGLSNATPYPVAGEAADVIEDVHRFGGIAIAAHPDSQRSSLMWTAWEAPIDGLEWLNADSEWRDESAAALLGAAVRSVVRPAETIASLFRRPVRTLMRWDRATATRPLVGLAGLDAHARIGWDKSEEPRRRTLAAWPSYEQMFRTLAQAVILDAALSGDPARDAAAILAALRAGRTYSLMRAIATPAALSFTATSLTGGAARMGERLEVPENPVVFHADVPLPGASLALVRDGRPVATGRGTLDYRGAPVPGAYRIEASVPGYDVPWIVSNPIYVGPAPSTTTATPDAIWRRGDPNYRLLDNSWRGWRTEHSATSTASIADPQGEVSFTFALGAGTPAGQYAAAVHDIGGTDAFDRVHLRARADRPMRVSVQLRMPGREGERYRRSIYIDTTPRELTLDVRTFEPVEPSTLRPNAARIQGLLFVVDTLNSLPGAAGQFWLTDVALRKAG